MKSNNVGLLVFVGFSVFTTAITVWVFAVIAGLTWKDFIPDFFILGVVIFWLCLGAFLVKDVLKRRQKLFDSGVLVKPDTFFVKYRTGSFNVFGTYNYQAKDYKFSTWFSSRKNKNVDEPASVFGVKLGSNKVFEALEAKGDRALIELKVDPHKPQKYLVLVDREF